MAASVRPFLQAMCSAVSPACRLNGGWEKESNFLQATRAFWSSRSLVRRTTEERRTNKTLKQLWTFPQKWKKRKEAAHPIFCIDSSARFDQKLNRQVIVGIIAGRCCIEHVAVFCQLKKPNIPPLGGIPTRYMNDSSITSLSSVICLTLLLLSVTCAPAWSNIETMHDRENFMLCRHASCKGVSLRFLERWVARRHADEDCTSQIIKSNNGMFWTT